MRRKLSEIKQKTWDRTKELRRDLTPFEKILWWHLQFKKLGVPFRKQHPIGPFIVDFCCVQCNLIVEIDGDSHYWEGRQEHDAERTVFLENLGWRIVRYTNSDVKNSIEAVVEDIRKHL